MPEINQNILKEAEILVAKSGPGDEHAFYTHFKTHVGLVRETNEERYLH